MPENEGPLGCIQDVCARKYLIGTNGNHRPVQLRDNLASSRPNATHLPNSYVSRVICHLHAYAYNVAYNVASKTSQVEKRVNGSTTILST